MIKKIFIILTILNGVFFYKGNFDTRFQDAQYAFFILSSGIFGSCLLYKKNKWMGFLGLVAILGFFKTYIFQPNYPEFLFKEFVGGIFIFLAYYSVRELDIKEDIYKWLLIPACLNILLIWVQTFDGNLLNFMPVKEVTGFFGNKSFTACFLALTIPIFIKYIPKSLSILVVTVLMCQSRMPLIVMLIMAIVYYKSTNIKLYRIYLWILLFFISVFTLNVVLQKDFLNQKLLKYHFFKERACMQVGTLDGIRHNPILGWGLGSFIPIVSKIPEQESGYCGTYFNQKNNLTLQDPAMFMNHPHNEYLYGWWNFGIFWVVGLFLLIWDAFKKFKRENILSFSILIGIFVLALGYFFTYPLWFIVALTLGVYHNQIQEV